jgi:hypothetical protein
MKGAQAGENQVALPGGSPRSSSLSAPWKREAAEKTAVSITREWVVWLTGSPVGRGALFLGSGLGRHNLIRNGMGAWACQNLPSLAAEPIPFFELYLLSWSGYREKNL